MDTDYFFRKATPADIPQLQQLGLSSYGRFAEVLGEEAWSKMAANLGNAETYEKLLEMAQCFICAFENEIVGMIFLIPNGHPTSFFQADWSYIRLLGVAPAHGGKGIGRILIEQCIACAQQANEKMLALHTSEFQNAARGIYESLGFKRMRTLEPIYGKTYWLYQLEL